MNNGSVQSHGFITFYKWNKKIYCLELNGTLVETHLSSRKAQFESILKSAENDLKDKPNGKWCFSVKTGWIKIPLSCSELIQLPCSEKTIKLNTRINPILPVLTDSDFFYKITKKKSKKGFSKQNFVEDYVLIEFSSNPRSVKILTEY